MIKYNAFYQMLYHLALSPTHLIFAIVAMLNANYFICVLNVGCAWANLKFVRQYYKQYCEYYA